MTDARTLRRTGLLLGVSVAVSVVHYVDNVVNHADYPAGGAVPAPSAPVVGVAWFVFTAAAAAAWALLRQGRERAAAWWLAAYSVSGLIGVGHYTVPGATSMAWWRQAHVVADIVCGLAVLAVAVALASRRSQRQSA